MYRFSIGADVGLHECWTGVGMGAEVGGWPHDFRGKNSRVV